MANMDAHYGLPTGMFNVRPRPASPHLAASPPPAAIPERLPLPAQGDEILPNPPTRCGALTKNHTHTHTHPL
eukprot:SAG11_NODE_1772_length_4273_cov_3.739578_6_plen_72_part_00